MQVSPSQVCRNGRLTVDGNGHGLGEDVAILALESWDLSKPVELLVVVADALGWLGGHDLEVDVVGLGDGENGGGAWVTLRVVVVSVQVGYCVGKLHMCCCSAGVSGGRGRRYLIGVELAESHGCCSVERWCICEFRAPSLASGE